MISTWTLNLKVVAIQQMWTLCHPSDQMEVGYSYIYLFLFVSFFSVEAMVWDKDDPSLPLYLFIQGKGKKKLGKSGQADPSSLTETICENFRTFFQLNMIP